MSDGWIEWHDGDSAPHPDTLIEVEYGAVRETRLAAGTEWRDVRRYRVLRPVAA